MGYGRSGSTVLDAVLGSHEDAVGVGELCNLATAGWQNNEYCACGKPANSCEFWVAVRQLWEARGDTKHLSQFVDDEHYFERSWLRWPRWLLAKLYRSERLRRYLTQLDDLYASISLHAGSLVIIESSKEPIRALYLRDIPTLEVHLLHLVRDPRGVAWSLRKSYTRDLKAGIQHAIKAQSAVSTALRWVFKNIQADFVRQTPGTGSALVMTYEKFCAQPCRLQPVMQKVGLSSDKLMARLNGGEPSPVGCAIAGNRARMRRHMTLSIDTEWVSKLSLTEHRLVSIITWPWRRRYGYDD